MTKLQKFPFKVMFSVINFLNENKKTDGIDIYNIMGATNPPSCYPDTTEVVAMLSYLTAFGQVKKISDGWILVNKQEFTSKKQFRERYLQELVSILTNLSDKAITNSKLEKILNPLTKAEIEEYLQFSQKLTAYGFVTKSSDGWKLEDYHPTPQAETSAD